MKKLTFNIITVILIYLSGNSFSAYSRDIYVNAALDTTTITIGDQILLHYIIELPVNERIQVPFLKDTITSHIEVIKLAKADSSLAGPGRARLHLAYLITSFDSGQWEIPTLPFVAGPDTIYSQPLLLTVNTVELKADKPFFDIKDILRAPLTVKEIVKTTSWGLLIAIIIGFIVYYLIRKKNNKPLFAAPKIVEPPHTIAFRDLEKLKEQKLWQQGKYKEYYSCLTDIIRIYIERRYTVPAMESTTDELMFALRQTKLVEPVLMDGLEKLLQSADLVKFAKAEPLPEENEQEWDTCYNFVKQTLHIPETPLQEEGNIQTEEGKSV